MLLCKPSPVPTTFASACTGILPEGSWTLASHIHSMCLQEAPTTRNRVREGSMCCLKRRLKAARRSGRLSIGSACRWTIHVWSSAKAIWLANSHCRRLYESPLMNQRLYDVTFSRYDHSRWATIVTCVAPCEKWSFSSSKMMKFHVVTDAADATTENSLPTTWFRPKLDYYMNQEQYFHNRKQLGVVIAT